MATRRKRGGERGRPGPRPAYDGAALTRVVKVPASVLEQLEPLASAEGVSVACLVRRAALALLVRQVGPGVLASLAVDPSEGEAWVRLARTDPDAAARRAYRR